MSAAKITKDGQLLLPTIPLYAIGKPCRKRRSDGTLENHHTEVVRLLHKRAPLYGAWLVKTAVLRGVRIDWALAEQLRTWMADGPPPDRNLVRRMREFSTGDAGCSDLMGGIMRAPGRGRWLAVEVKLPGDKLDVGQENFRAIVQDARGVWISCGSEAQFAAALEAARRSLVTLQEVQAAAPPGWRVTESTIAPKWEAFRVISGGSTVEFSSDDPGKLLEQLGDWHRANWKEFQTR